MNENNFINNQAEIKTSAKKAEKHRLRLEKSPEEKLAILLRNKSLSREVLIEEAKNKIYDVSVLGLSVIYECGLQDKYIEFRKNNERYTEEESIYFFLEKIQQKPEKIEEKKEAQSAEVAVTAKKEKPKKDTKKRAEAKAKAQQKTTAQTPPPQPAVTPPSQPPAPEPTPQPAPAPKAPENLPVAPLGSREFRDKLKNTSPEFSQILENAEGWNELSFENQEKFAEQLLNWPNFCKDILDNNKKLIISPDIESRIKTKELYIFDPVILEDENSVRIYFEYDDKNAREILDPISEIKKDKYVYYFDKLEKASRWKNLAKKTKEDICRYFVRYFDKNPYEMENLEDMPFVFEFEQEKEKINKKLLVKDFAILEEIGLSGNVEKRNIICQILLSDKDEPGKRIDTPKRILNRKKMVSGYIQEGLILSAIRTPAEIHRTQDNYFLHTFNIDPGYKICVGAVSDGVSTDQSGNVKDPLYHPELGARWLSKQFCIQVEEMYKKGYREEELMRKVALGLAEKMKNYIPQNPKSDWLTFKSSEIEASYELSTKLIGFVMDNKTCSMLVSGDGNVIINGKSRGLKTKNAAPILILSVSPDQWEDKISEVFSMVSFPSSSLQNFGISTDGFDPDEIESQNQIFEFDTSLLSVSSKVANDKYDDRTLVLVSRVENGKLAVPKHNINIESIVKQINRK